jgi:hypothetical protein
VYYAGDIWGSATQKTRVRFPPPLSFDSAVTGQFNRG